MIHVMIIDALNLIRRIYAVEEKNTPVNAPKDQLIKKCSIRVKNAAIKLRKQLQPSHGIAVFDGEPGWRLQLYPDYKLGRAKMPDVLASGLEQIKDALLEAGLDSYTPLQDEADDIIATLASKVANSSVKTKVKVSIVSTDKGFLPLISEQVAVYDYFQQHYSDEHSINERFQVPKHLLTAYWGLAGDPTNNIPGIPGIGKKTAIKILAETPDFEQAIISDSLSASVKKKLVDNKDKFDLSKQLATLNCDAELGFNLNQIRLV